MMSAPLLRLTQVKKYFPLKRGLVETLTGQPAPVLKAVDDVTLDLRRGEVFGLAGESGSGKSTLGRLAVRLHRPTAGTIEFEGQAIQDLPESALRPLRRQMQTIFQDPVASMNPRMTLLEGIGDGLKIHGLAKNERELRAQVGEMMEHVGLKPAEQYFTRYPHQLSGGQR